MGTYWPCGLTAAGLPAGGGGAAFGSTVPAEFSSCGFNLRLSNRHFWYATAMDKLLSRITIDPAICHGKLCVRGLRYPVETLLELLSSGMTIDEILADYEDLERDDLLAVLVFATRRIRTRGGQS